MDEIQCERLRLVEATAALLDADRSGPAALEAALGFEVPAEWPSVRKGAPQGWWLHYVVLRATEAGGRPLLIGACGFVGPPDGAGSVVLWVAILEEFRNCGFATESTQALVAHALGERRVQRVVAQTRSDRTASIRVLEKAGFTLADTQTAQDVLRYMRQRQGEP